jgi:hypothetical protein
MEYSATGKINSDVGNRIICFMKKTVLQTTAILLILAGMIIACRKEEPVNTATGTIIGSYNNGFTSTIVQVDNKYSTGKSIVEYSTESDCLYLPESGTYHNLIQIQGIGCKEGDKISFDYRDVNWDNQEDVDLFVYGPSRMHCTAPDVPIYNYKI